MIYIKLMSLIVVFCWFTFDTVAEREREREREKEEGREGGREGEPVSPVNETEIYIHLMWLALSSIYVSPNVSTTIEFHVHVYISTGNTQKLS